MQNKGENAEKVREIEMGEDKKLETGTKKGRARFSGEI